MADMDVARASRDRLRKRQETGTQTVKGDGSDTSATEREKFTSGLGSGKTSKGGGSDMPKQSDYPSFEAYTAAVGAWRRKKTSGATMNDAGAALSKRLN